MAPGWPTATAAPYATPRRLAVLVPGVPGTQPDRDVERRGPPLARAFDDNDRPTKAALGFARSVGVDVDRLVRIETGDGAWLGYRVTKAGATLSSLLPGMVERALARLPVPRRMRWADRDTEFVRPVHWVVLMHGAEADRDGDPRSVPRVAPPAGTASTILMTSRSRTCGRIRDGAPARRPRSGPVRGTHGDDSRTGGTGGGANSAGAR